MNSIQGVRVIAIGFLFLLLNDSAFGDLPSCTRARCQHCAVEFILRMCPAVCASCPKLPATSQQQFAGEYESKETEKSSTSEAPQTEVQPTAQYFQEAQPMKEVPSRLKLQPAERLSEPKLLTASEVIPPKFSPEISGPFSITSKNHQKPHSSRHRNHHENKATGTQVHHILKVLAQGSHNHEQGEQALPGPLPSRNAQHLPNQPPSVYRNYNTNIPRGLQTATGNRQAGVPIQKQNLPPHQAALRNDQTQYLQQQVFNQGVQQLNVPSATQSPFLSAAFSIPPPPPAIHLPPYSPNSALVPQLLPSQQAPLQPQISQQQYNNQRGYPQTSQYLRAQQVQPALQRPQYAQTVPQGPQLPQQQQQQQYNLQQPQLGGQFQPSFNLFAPQSTPAGIFPSFQPFTNTGSLSGSLGVASTSNGPGAFGPVPVQSSSLYNPFLGFLPQHTAGSFPGHLTFNPFSFPTHAPFLPLTAATPSSLQPLPLAPGTYPQGMQQINALPTTVQQNQYSTQYNGKYSDAERPAPPQYSQQQQKRPAIPPSPPAPNFQSQVQQSPKISRSIDASPVSYSKQAQTIDAKEGAAQCPRQPNWQPCIAKPLANERFRNCCSSLGEGCLPLCDYDATLTNMQLAVLTGRCPLAKVADVMMCASGREDATSCCEAYGVFEPGFEHCRPYCNPAAGLPQNGLLSEKYKCLVKLTFIQQCFFVTQRP